VFSAFDLLMSVFLDCSIKSSLRHHKMCCKRIMLRKTFNIYHLSQYYRIMLVLFEGCFSPPHHYLQSRH